MSKRVPLSSRAKREIRKFLCDASLARHLASECAALGTVLGSERAAYYRAENRRFLRQARALVLNDRSFKGDSTNAPVQVSATPAYRRLSLLCVLVQAGKGRTPRQPVHCLPRLRAPWAPLSGQWPLVLPAPLRLRAVQAQAPTLAQLDRCARYRRADSLCTNPRAIRIGGMN